MMRTLRRFVIVTLGVATALGILHFINLFVPSPFQPVVVEPGKSMPIPGDPLAALDARQRGALQRWLAEHDQYEVIAIYYCDFELRRSSCEIRLTEGNPYLAAGDFNGDGHRDFAMILQVKRSSPLRTYLAIFNGPYADDAVPQPALFVEDHDFMRLGDELFSSTADGRTKVFLGPGESDNGYSIVPKDNGYELSYEGNVG